MDFNRLKQVIIAKISANPLLFCGACVALLGYGIYTLIIHLTTEKKKEKEQEEIKINQYDGVSVKATLDDAVVDVLTGGGSERAFVESTRYSNYRILLGILSICAALIAQFYPLPFPHNKMVLVACCFAYFCCACALQYLSTSLERDYIFFSHDHQFRVASVMPKYDEIYTLTFVSGGSVDGYDEVAALSSAVNYSDGGGDGGSRKSSVSKAAAMALASGEEPRLLHSHAGTQSATCVCFSVALFFDCNGVFHRSQFIECFKQWLEQHLSTTEDEGRTMVKESKKTK